MIFGNTATFALELEMINSPFGRFRAWIGGRAIGDFAIVSASVTILECFIHYLTLPQREEFTEAAPVLFDLMKETSFGKKWPNHNSYKFIQYFFAPGYPPFDEWWGVMLPLGSQIRFIFRRHDEQILNDVLVPTEEVTACLEQAKKWVEWNYHLRWTAEGFLDTASP